MRFQLVKTHYILSHKCKIISRQRSLIITHSLKPALKHERYLKVFKMSYLQQLPLAAFRNEFQPVSFLMDLTCRVLHPRLLLRLDATLAIETSSTWIAILDPPFWVPEQPHVHRVFVISHNATLFQLSRYPLSSKSLFGINHTQWHRLFQRKASTIINGIDC